MIHSQAITEAQTHEEPVDVGNALPVRAVYFIEEFAALLGCSTRTVRRRLNAGHYRFPAPLPAIDGRPRWSKAEVDRWIAGGAHRR